MAYPGLKDDVKRCVAGQAPKRLPVFGCSEEFDVRIAGENYERYCSSAETMVAVQKKIVKRMDYDWVWLQIDDCIEFELLGVGVKGGGDILRATCDYLPATPETLKRLRIPDFARQGRAKELLAAIKALKKEFGDTAIVVGRTSAPFSAATLLYGINEVMTMLVDNAALLEQTMDFLAKMQIEFGLAQLEAGADAIWLGDCCASSHLISLQHWERFARPGLNRVSERYLKAGGMTFLHASEEKEKFIDKMADLKISAISIGPNADLKMAHRVCKGRMAILGNVDPIKTLLNGTPNDVKTSVERIVREVSVGGGHMLNSGEMISRDTPEENIAAMVKTGREAWAATRTPS